MPRATEHIPQMVELIRKLLDPGNAYRTDDGSIFFRIASWPDYGRLARLDPEGMRVGERVEADEYGKDDVRDFALWKGPKPGEPSWDTAIGPGRPGWHIECSAMSMRYLGPSFDIHTGGVDLIFPHHTTRSPRARRPPASSSWPTGSTAPTCRWAARRCPSRSATSIGSRGYRPGCLAPGPPTGPDFGPLPMALSFGDDSLAAAEFGDRSAGRAARGPGGLPQRLPGRRHTGCTAGRRHDGIRSRPRRRPEHLAGAGCGVRAGPRAEPADRRATALDGRRGPCDDFLRDLDRVLGIAPAAEDALEADLAGAPRRTGRRPCRSGLVRLGPAADGSRRTGHPCRRHARRPALAPRVTNSRPNGRAERDRTLA